MTARAKEKAERRLRGSSVQPKIAARTEHRRRWSRRVICDMVELLLMMLLMLAMLIHGDETHVLLLRLLRLPLLLKIVLLLLLILGVTDTLR